VPLSIATTPYESPESKFYNFRSEETSYLAQKHSRSYQRGVCLTVQSPGKKAASEVKATVAAAITTEFSLA
jgi:hypothetical protein